MLNHIVPGELKNHSDITFDDFLERNGTTAFIMIRNDEVLYERYFNGFRHNSICTSFSTAKSFVSALIGIAISEKLIQNIDDPIVKYLPELSDLV